MSDRDDTDRWVRGVNGSARRLDEQAAAIHPSAWQEQLADETERYKRIARRGGATRDR